METLRAPTTSLDTIELPSLRAFLQSRGYKYRERWGTYLDRYSRKLSGREQHVLVPTERHLVDFEKRMADVLEALTSQLKTPASVLIKQVVNSGYEVVRIAANPGEESSTIAYDAAIDLLRGGFALIDSSAVVTVADETLRIVRGRRPDAVRRYLDGVRVGQTEVGSFVLTLLMPTNVNETAFDLPQSFAESFGRKVAESMATALKATERAAKKGEFAVNEVMQHGVTANFSGGIARMIEAVGDVSVGLAAAVDDRKAPRFPIAHFEKSNLRTLRELERRLTPKEQRKPLTIAGTVTEFREPRAKTSGTIVLSAQVYGEERPVRLSFTKDQRAMVLEAIEQKSDLLLRVSGDLISRSGHYNLDEPHGFELVRRGPLA